METKIRHKWIYLRNRNRLTDIENKLVVARGRLLTVAGGWIESLGLADANYYIYIGWISKKVLLYGTGNCIQYLVVNYKGKE